MNMKTTTVHLPYEGRKVRLSEILYTFRIASIALLQYLWLQAIRPALKWIKKYGFLYILKPLGDGLEIIIHFILHAGDLFLSFFFSKPVLSLCAYIGLAGILIFFYEICIKPLLE